MKATVRNVYEMIEKLHETKLKAIQKHRKVTLKLLNNTKVQLRKCEIICVQQKKQKRI